MQGCARQALAPTGLFFAMKRAQDTAALSSPQHKKPKVEQDDAEWTRVERRKAKKARKREAKLDVRPLHVP